MLWVLDVSGRLPLLLLCLAVPWTAAAPRYQRGDIAFGNYRLQHIGSTTGEKTGFRYSGVGKEAIFVVRGSQSLFKSITADCAAQCNADTACMGLWVRFSGKDVLCKGIPDVGHRVRTSSDSYSFRKVSTTTSTKSTTKTTTTTTSTITIPSPTTHGTTITTPVTTPATTSSSTADTAKLTTEASTPSKKASNVLLIIADDLRPELGSYGFPVHTPALDRLAQQGVQFQWAYAQQSVCSPSRASMLLGMRPDTLGFIKNGQQFRPTWQVATLPEYFKNNGYYSFGVGKVYHGDIQDDRSWHERKHRKLKDPCKRRCNSWEGKGDKTDINDFPDGKAASSIIDFLQGREENAPPFMITYGLRKPHLPYIVPQEYLDLYPDPQRAVNDSPPDDLPSIAWSSYNGLHKYRDTRPFRTQQNKVKNIIPNAVAKNLRRGYWATTSFVDAQVNRVLETIEQLGLYNDTTVVFLSDHGFTLGEHGHWTKTTNFETDTKVPFIIRSPELNHLAGTKVGELIELLDLFPTLLDLHDLPVPGHIEGVSRLPLLQGLSSGAQTTSISGAAFSQYPRKLDEASPIMGYSIRTPLWRYTAWVQYDKTAYRPNFQKTKARELYAHEGDDGANWNWENQNLADKSRYEAVVRELHLALEVRYG